MCQIMKKPVNGITLYRDIGLYIQMITRPYDPHGSSFREKERVDVVVGWVLKGLRDIAVNHKKYTNVIGV